MKRVTVANLLAVAVLIVGASLAAQGQETPPTIDQSSGPQAPQTTSPSPQSSTLDNTLDAGESDTKAPARRLVSWNEYDGKYLSVRAGGTFLWDFAAYAQNNNSKAQFALNSDDKLRDFRFVFGGRLKFFERPVTYSLGIMYEANNEEWLFRQTGIMVEVPEIWGYLFIGRTKEGFSLLKVMNGTTGYGMERFPMNDAIPILADGIKWFGYNAKRHFIWNLGFYGDWLSHSQSFSTYSYQVSGRFAWVPLESETEVFHLGLSARYGVPENGMLRLRSRPEAFPAPYFVETEQFPAKDTRMLGAEVYYRPGPLLVGGEYIFQKVNAPESGDPFFHGGNVFVSWLPTGETRSYNTRGGFFNGISPTRTVFQGGPGAWELVAGFSYLDLDSGSLRGGKFWRFTPMVNWHLSDNMRLEGAYGYGSLNRFGLVGKTHFFQSRIQFTL